MPTFWPHIISELGGVKYHEEENIKREKKVLRERKYSEEICDENGLPE